MKRSETEILESTETMQETENMQENGKVTNLSEEEVEEIREFLNTMKHHEVVEVSEEDEEDTIEVSHQKVPSIWARIDKRILFLCLCAMTFVCWLCFKLPLFSILLIVEVLVASIYLLYSTADSDVVTLDSFSDGIKYMEPEEDGMLLKDLVIQEPAEELQDLVDYLKNPDEFEELGYRPEKKILMFGDAGYGKNALIKAFSNETGLPVIKVNGARFFDSDDVVEKIFELAEKNPDISYIIFIECFEKLLENASDSSDSSETVIDKINTYLDQYPNIILFTTCESPSSLMAHQDDYAGMFKKVITFKMPKLKERIQLLQEFTRELTLDENVDLQQYAKNCYDFSIGDLKYLVSKSASISRKNKHSAIQIEDFLEAFDLLSFGKSDKKHNKEARKVVAYHESGHALVHYLKKGSKDLLRVISISRGDSGGLTFSGENLENIVYTEQDLLNEVCICYGGRCAESLVFGRYSSGASADIQQATSLICNMIQTYGMSKEIGPLNVSPLLSSVSNIAGSPDIMNLVAKEGQRIAKACDEETLKLLAENRDKLDKLANYLMENESITGEELDALLKEE